VPEEIYEENEDTQLDQESIKNLNIDTLKAELKETSIHRKPERNIKFNPMEYKTETIPSLVLDEERVNVDGSIQLNFRKASSHI
jgi:hypothetical protein